MSEGAIQLPLRWGAQGSNGARPAVARREARGAGVRLVEYAPFPRSAATREWRVGFTRDLSDSGLCLEVDRGIRVGSLLRVMLRRIDGRPSLDRLARVVWCHAKDGICRVGLSLIRTGGEDRAGVRPARSAAARQVA